MCAGRNPGHGVDDRSPAREVARLRAGARVDAGMRTAALLAVGLGFAAVPAAASAAPPWSAPQTVPGSTMANPFTVGLSLGNAERGALGFTSTFPPTIGCTQIASVAGAGRGAPGRPRSLEPYDLAAPPAAYANTRAILLQRRTLDSTCRSSRLVVSFASLPGSLGTRRTLDDRVNLRHAAVAVNARGQAAVVWTEDKGYRGRRANNDRLYLALRPAGGTFGSPSVLVGSGKLSGVSVAYGASGDLLVAFERQAIDARGMPGPRRVQARFRRAGHGFGALTDLGPEQGVTQIVTAITPGGRGYVAWGTQDGGIEANDPFNVWAAGKAAGTHSFRRAAHLFSGKGSDVDRSEGRLGLAMNGENAVLAFSGLADAGPPLGTIRPVLVSDTDANATFRPPVALAGANGAVGGVVTQPDATATIVWTQIVPGAAAEATGVLAATRPPGASFSPFPELVAPLPAQPIPIAAVAVPARGGRVQAAWLERGVGVRVSRRG
jgi:hypothetical protein